MANSRDVTEGGEGIENDIQQIMPCNRDVLT